MLRPILPRATQLALFTSSTPASFTILGRGGVQARSNTTAAMTQRRIKNPAIFICDLQEKFRPAIHEFPKVVTTAQKMLKASQILNIPVFATTQNKARLGETCPELGLDAPGGVQTVVHADKTLFSMVTPEILSAIATLPPSPASSPNPQKLSCVLIGIESHICITQTALDLLSHGHAVAVLADGVSSCNKEEIPIALARLRAAGVTVTTSESWLYECLGDAGAEEFRGLVGLVRDSKRGTAEALGALCGV